MKAFDVVVNTTISELNKLNADENVNFNLIQNSDGRDYNGYNFFLLNVIKQANKYNSDIFVTYNKAKEFGAKVKNGAKTHPVLFWNFITKKNEEDVIVQEIPFMKYYKVFNLDDIENNAALLENIKSKIVDLNDIVKYYEIEKTGRIYFDILQLVEKTRQKLEIKDTDIETDKIINDFAIAMILSKTNQKEKIQMIVKNITPFLNQPRKLLASISKSKKIANNILLPFLKD